MEYNSRTSSILLPFFMNLKQLNVNRMGKMNDRVPKERLGTSRLNDVFLQTYLYDPTHKLA